MTQRTALLRIYRDLYKAYGPQGWWPADSALEMILGAFLTQNTSWSNVEKALDRLKSKGALTVQRLGRMSPAAFQRAIRPAGYFRVKTRRIGAFIRFLNERHEGSLQKLFRQPTAKLRRTLLGLHGVGPETADSIVLYAAGRPVFVVDAYTRRLFGRLGMLSPGAGYDEVQSLFRSRLPKSPRLYNEYHALIVRHSKEYCRATPRCPACPILRRCPAGRGVGGDY